MPETGVTIYQPSHNDLDSLKESFVRMASENKSYIKILEEMCNEIKKNKQNSALMRYAFGMRDNFLSEIYKKYFGVDAAFCIFNNNDRKLWSNKFSIPPDDFKKTNLSEDTRQNGFYSYEEFVNLDEINVFKVGKVTGLTTGKMVSTYSSVSIDLRDKSIKYAKNYMKTPLVKEINKMRQQCYPTVWFDRQLIFAFRPGDFVSRDSKASIVNKEGKALGILHAVWITENSNYAIAFPYFAIFEALNVTDQVQLQVTNES
ncbi:12635_t:CDS:2 [Funneliformis mosseae]|uniref:12635_t:CDS:1 n=1 Tax=Funneliformis mosseae TaxID=27381 RepID=A0A9N9HYG7_FUNMO|nr:12635_t:CDS:2 [Funneliformis mosseae]